MIIDALLLLDPSGSAITVTRDSTNVIDLLNPRDLGNAGYPLKLAVFVTTAFTAGGAGTLTVEFQGSADNLTYTTYAKSRAYAIADLVVGSRLLAIDWPMRDAVAVLPRYIKAVYTVATGPMLTGAVFAGMVLDRQDPNIYPAGITVAN